MSNWSFQQEFIYSVKAECQSLIKEHWQEIALNKDKVKLNPDWDIYRELEIQGKLKIFTCRFDGKLVGYFVVLIGKNLHYKDHLFANNDILFVSKPYRKGMAGIKLIKFAESCLVEDGVSVLNINTKLHKPFGRLLERLKFKPIEMVYSKYIGK